MIELTPGVVATPVVDASVGQFAVNGQRNDTNYVTVDGISANFAAPGAASLFNYLNEWHSHRSFEVVPSSTDLAIMR